MSIIITIIVSILFSAFFSGMEIAYVSSNKLKIELYRKEKSFNSKIVSLLSKYPGQYIVTMLIGNNIALVIYGIFMAILLEPVFYIITENDITILILQTIAATIIILFTAEFLPKTLFRIDPNSFLKIFATPVFGKVEIGDLVNEEKEDQEVNNNEFIFSGRFEIDYINEKYNLSLPKSVEYETLAGLILHYYESIPNPKERIIVESFEFEILEVSETRIELVNLKILHDNKEG